MRRSLDEREVQERFAKIYGLGGSEVMLSIERSVCGSDYGATSWTTLDEAGEVAAMLGLRPGRLLLDLGSGSGWPGVYLARESGCDIVMLDLPPVGLRIAMQRAAAERVAGACSAVVADGAAMPLQSGRFDAIFHTDVLCCLEEKLAVLKSCRRVVRNGGRMVFSVIMVAPGLAAADRGRGVTGGPPFVGSDMDYPEMLDRAGWEIAERRDTTAEYLKNVTHRLALLETHAEEITALYGDADAAAERTRRRATVEALVRGLLRRELFSAVPAAVG